MRRREAWLTLISLTLVSACGQAFTAGTTDTDASRTGGLDAASEAATSDVAVNDATADLQPPPVADALLLWLRADIGITDASGAVSSWADQSGNHLDAQQVDDTARPTLSATALSGHPAVVFSGDDFLTLPTGFADFSRGITLFAVALVNDAPVTCADILHLSNGPEIDDIALGRNEGRGSYEVLDGTLAGDDFPLGRAELIAVQHGPDRSVTMRFNGSRPTNGTFDLPRLAPRQNNMIGRSLYVGCGTVQGAIAEILVYRRLLDNTERAAVEAQLQARWACCH